MGQLYDMCKRVGEQLERKHSGDPMGLLRAKGELATRVGFLVSMVGPNDADDPVKIGRVVETAHTLGITL